MKWWCGAFLLAIACCPLRAQEDLPQPDDSQPLEIEPPLLIPSRNADGTPNLPTPPEQVDIVKLETDLARAQRNAASGERMYRAGIISKVDSEERALKVVRLEAQLAEARLEAARSKLHEQKTQAQVEIEAQLRAGETEVAEATRLAEEAAAERRRAELEAAMRNLARQQKLLALGSGRRADVSRAQKKLAELTGRRELRRHARGAAPLWRLDVEALDVGRSLLLLAVFATDTKAAPKTIAERVTEFGAIVRERLEPKFRAAGVSYPPRRVTLIGLKRERRLEVHAAGADGVARFICAYPVLAASGRLGPKLREGDRQVPEGIYRVRGLNPNSRFHLSLWIDYPNAFDRARATADRRTNLGGEIMIHGNFVSKGCLAMGDPAAEDLFVLAALTGIENVSVIFAPMDFRTES